MEREVRTDLIIKDYLNLEPPKGIAEKYGCDIIDIKKILKDNLGNTLYLTIARKIGARIVNTKIRTDPAYRAKYSDKMRRSVSSAILFKMKDDTFRSNWRNKAILASKKGNEKIMELLMDEQFAKRWKARCEKSGIESYILQTGIHNIANKSNRKAWSLLGLRNTCRKCNGPRGERMYNNLEIKTADVLHSFRVNYEYEKIFDTSDGNGFYSVDFFIHGENPFFIEVTYWDDIDEKAKQITKKFNSIKSKITGGRFFLVTKPSMVHQYKAILSNEITVLDLNGLERQIAGSGVTATK